MNKLNFYNNHCSHSTNTSNHSARVATVNQHQHYISPFPILQHSPSLSRQRLQSSPLQVPLAIAINKLAKRTKNHDHINTNRNLFKTNRQKQHIEQLMDSSQMQNLKNILEQFAQSLYATVEKEIYSKFNCQMKRMNVKYRQTEMMLGKIHEKLTLNADIIQLQRKYRVKVEHNRQNISELEQTIMKMTKEMQILKKKYEVVGKQSVKMQKENVKLKENNQKYENTLIKFMEQVQNKKKYQQKERLSYLEAFQSQKERQRTSMKDYRKPLKSTLASYHNEVSTIQHANSLSHSYIQNVNKLEPTHSPVKGSQKAAHDMPRRARPEGNKCHFQLIISEKE